MHTFIFVSLIAVTG